MSTSTRTRCSSTPRADTLVNPTGSTTRTFPSRGMSPPHRPKRTGVPGRIRTASAERTSTSTSRRPGSPTSSSGVPAWTTPSLSCRTASTLPVAGERTGTRPARTLSDAPARVSTAFAASRSCRAASAAASADRVAALARLPPTPPAPAYPSGSARRPRGVGSGRDAPTRTRRRRRLASAFLRRPQRRLGRRHARLRGGRVRGSSPSDRIGSISATVCPASRDPPPRDPLAARIRPPGPKRRTGPAASPSPPPRR